MIERVSTGGLMDFKYNKNHNLKLSKEEKSDIEKAYLNYDKRKKKEKIRKYIILITILIVTGISLFFLFLN